MISIPGCYRPSSYFPVFSSRPAKYRTGLFLGGTVLLLFLLVPGSRSVFAQSGTGIEPCTSFHCRDSGGCLDSPGPKAIYRHGDL